MASSIPQKKSGEMGLKEADSSQPTIGTREGVRDRDRGRGRSGRTMAPAGLLAGGYGSGQILGRPPRLSLRNPLLAR